MAASSLKHPEWKHISGPNPYTVFTKSIQKSPQDDREYRLIQLQNGLQSMLVHDPKADKAAASLDVAVGHLYDPDDMPGLAHFCEHLLFMGTEQYPKDNEYSEYLARNNGSSNAYTGTSNTNYYFSVATAALPGALSRFAAFFHSPLFSPSCTSRELSAVDSEFKKNHQSDIWRIFQVNKHLSIDGHPWRKFGSGNRESLERVGMELKAEGLLNGNGNRNGATESAGSSLAVTPSSSRAPSPTPSSSSELEGDGGVVGRETRRRLVEWWSKEYCASRMRLCVIGKEPLDELADMVAELFSPIPNRAQDPLPKISQHPFGPKEMGTLVSVQTVMSFHAVEISFPLDYQPPHWKHEPAHFLSHFLGHEGPGSLHSYLKNKGWVSALSAGPQLLARNFAMMKVTLHLTPEGFENYRAAMLVVFKYLSLLRASPFPAWNQREQSKIRATRFRFAEKRRPDDYAVWVAEHLSWPVPPELLLSAPQLVWEWDDSDPVNGGEGEMREVLESLRAFRGRAVLMAKAEEFERVMGKDLTWEHESWYGTPYRVERLNSAFVAEAERPNDIPELFLPGPNEFIPANLDVEKRPVDQPSKRPRLIRETPLSSLWHKKDDQFWVPKAQVVMEIRSPASNTSARACVLTRLFADLVNDSLTEFAYDADLAGLSYSFSSHALGVYVTLSGYNDKLHVLARDVVKRVKNLHIKADRLQVMKDLAKRDWENFFLGQPYRLSDYFAHYLTMDQQWTFAEKLEEIESITVEELQAHVPQLLSKLYMRMLIVGNMHKDDAVRLAEMTENILQSSPIHPCEMLDRALLLPCGANHAWTMDVPNTNEPNSSLTYYLHLGSLIEPRSRVTSALLTQILSEPAFNVLRTREQLGYVVSCSQWPSSGDGETGLRIVVQSERSPVYLEERVDAFFDEMKEKIEEMPEKEFEEQKGGLERRWREGVKNLAEETGRYWTHIDSGYLDFLRRESDALLVKSITKEDVLSLFMSRVHHSSPSRAKLSVHVRSQKKPVQRISIPAMKALEAILTQRGIHITDTEGWRELTKDGEPLVSQFVQYWQDTFGGISPIPPELAQDAMSSLSALMERYPTQSKEEEENVKEGVTMIKDPKAFKASLRKSDEPRPLVDWGDLPTSKY
ncbi:insulin-degrading enzyme [Sparassis latifolia]